MIIKEETTPHQNTAPHLVHIHDVHLDDDYTQWLVELKTRYRSAQITAAVKINAEKLLFNWQLGRDLVVKKAEERWGTGVVEQVSLDLHAEFPNDKGFSTRNLWYMKQWYEFYTREPQFLQRVVAEIQIPEFFEGIQTPLGVATYNGIKISDVLPSEELLRQRVRQLEHELRLSRRLIHHLSDERS